MKKRMLLFTALLLVFTFVRAANFERLPYTIVQPNGDTISCFVSGDEYSNYIHDAEGYTIIQAANGYFYYAERNGEEIIPSSYLVNSVNPANTTLSKWAIISKTAYLQRRAVMYNNPTKTNGTPSYAPHSGTMNNLVIYIRFSNDAEFTTTRQVYDDKLNPTTGLSLKSYYKEVSYNNFTINSTHYPACALTTNLSYQDSHPRNYYQPYNATTNPTGYANNSESATREHTLLVAAVNWINANSPVSAALNIDGDNDGNVDNVLFVIKGSNGAWADMLWAHRWMLYTQFVYINSKRVYDYTFQPETQVTVPTLCHEMFHALGSPDLYHYTNQGVVFPVWNWDLMENGSGHMLSYMKWKYSAHTWISNIPEITTSGTYTLNPVTSATNNCYKIASPNSTSEYFMVEYRNKSGTFETNVPGSGLIVYRIDESATGNADGPPDEVYVYRPGGTSAVNGTPNDAFFSSTVGRTSINDATNPSCFLQSGGAGGLNISNVTAAGTTISFNVTFPVTCTPTTQASTFTTTAIANNSMTAGWTRGNGNAVIVLARAGGAVDANPVNGTNYIANPAFGTGSQIGVGNYVVYMGAATSVNLTALSTGTAYHYAVYEYNSSGYCYRTPALTGNATTTGSAPCNHCASNGNTTFNTSITLVNFNMINKASAKPAGYNDYTAYTTTVNKNSSYNLTVNVNTDGDYTIHAYAWIDWNQDCDFLDAGESYDLGTAYGVTNGATSLSPLSINIPASALTGNTRMRISAKYNVAPTCCETDFDGEVEDYTVQISASTCAPPSIQATALTTSAITNNSISVGCTRGNGNTILVLAHLGSAVNADPVDGNTYTASAIFGNGSQIGNGNYVVYNGSGNSVNVSGLAVGTNYYFAVYEVSLTNCYKSPALTGNASTTGTPPATCDTLTNLVATDNLTYYIFTSPDWGFWTGHNSYSVTEYAEYYSGVSNPTITGLEVFVYDSYSGGVGGNHKVTFKIYAGGGTSPGAVLGTKDVMMSSLTPIAINHIQFDSPILITGIDVFVGYQIYYNTPADTFSVVQAVSRPDFTNSGYIKYGANWLSFPDASTYSLYSAIDISPIVCPNCAPPSAPIVGTITQPTCISASGSVVLSGLPAIGTWTLTRTPGGTTTIGSGTSTTLSGIAPGTYTYVVTNASSCMSVSSANIIINSLPSPPNTPTVGNITQPSCILATGSVVLNDLPSAGSWTLTRSPGGTTTTGTGSSTTLSGLVAGTYSYTVTNSLSCISVASASIVINSQPSTPTAPVIGITTQPTCSVSTGSVVLNGLPSSGSWTLTQSPGGNTTTGTGTSSTITGLASGTYTFTVSNSSSCTSPASANVIINIQPTTPTAPIVGAITQPTCVAPTANVTLNGLPASGTWTLTRSPGGITTTGTGISSTVTGLAAGTYSWTVTNASTCVSLPSATVVINAPPSAPTAPIVGSITQPTCILATGSVILNGLPATGNWTLSRSPGGITTTGSGASTTITGLAAGTYTYTVTNNLACTSIASSNVLINAQPATPTAPIIGSITQPSCVLASGSVILNGLPATGSWTLTRSPGGTTSTGTGSSYTVSGLAAGTYTYTVSNANCTSVASSNIVINTQPPTPSINNQTTSMLTGTSFTVSPTGVPLGTTYTWTTPTYSGGVSGGTAQNVAQTNISGNLSIPSGIGTATYIVTPTSGSCVGNTFTVTVTVYFSCMPVSVGTQPNNINMCASTGNASISVLANGTAPFVYQWQYYNGSSWVNVSNGVPSGVIYSNTIPQTLNISGISTAGSYQYQCYITNCSGGGNATSAAVTLTVDPSPTTPTIGPITQPSCIVTTGSVFLYDLPASGGWTLTQTPGGTTSTGTGTGVTITGLAPGTYTFVVTNASGCISSSSASVVIDAVPTVPTAPTVGPITQPTISTPTASVFLYDLPMPGTWTLTQSPGGTITTGTGTGTTLNGLAPGTYTFTVTNASGCSSLPSANVVINIPQPPTPTITLVSNVLHSDATAGNQWYNQNGIISGAINQDHIPLINGDYHVVVTLNGYSSNPSNIIQITDAGVANELGNTAIKVYPNPVSNELIIEIKGNSQPINFEILNSIGQMVFKGKVLEKEIIQTSGFSNGIYLIKLENGKSFEFKKIIKQ